MAKALMGAALLAAIGAGTVTRITQDQAKSLDASHFQVNTADVENGAAAVQLTDAGKAAIGAAPAPAGKIVIDEDVPMPTTARRGRQTEATYPFEALEKVGQSFHVPKTAANPDPAIRLSSSVSGARVKFSPVINGDDGKPVMESYTRPTYQLGSDGKPVKGEDGKRVKTGEETLTREKRGEPTRDFRVVTVGADDPRGEGARVFRIK